MVAKRFKACLMFSAVMAAVIFLTGCGSTAKGPETSKSYAFWPQAPQEPRIQFLVSYNLASDVRENKGKGGINELLYGKENEQDVALAKPYGVAISDGRLYVCDLQGAGILVLDVRKKEARLMGATGAGTIKSAKDIFVAPDGTKYVADAGRGAILIFDRNERFLRALGPADLKPVGVAVYGNEIFVVDLEAKMVKVLDLQSGQQLRTIGRKGTEPGEFIMPLSVAIDSAGCFYVTDVVLCRVQKFSREGAFISAFGRTGNSAGDFVRPKHVRVAPDGTIFVVDAAFNNVQQFDEEGKIMGFFGSLGAHPGSMDLPAGLAISEDPADLELFKQYVHPDFIAQRLIVVTNNFGGNKVAIYAYGNLRPGKNPNDLVSSVSATAGLEAEGTKPTTVPTTLPARPMQ